MEKTIISQADARMAGLTKFYTGKPCKYGHMVERYTSTGACLSCHNERARGTHVLVRTPRDAEAFLTYLVQLCEAVPTSIKERCKRRATERELWIDGESVGEFGSRGERDMYMWQWMLKESDREREREAAAYITGWADD
jgi:hypothetical protein